MRKYAKMIAAGAAVAILSSGSWFVPETLVYAADAAACELAVDSTSVEQGKEFTISVNLTSNPGLAMTEGALTFDTSVLEFVKEETNDLFKTDSDISVYTAANGCNDTGTVKLIDGYDLTETNSTQTGTMFTLTFKVKNDAEIGATTEVGYSANFIDADLASTDATAETLTLTVVEAVAEEPSTEEPTTEPSTEEPTTEPSTEEPTTEPSTSTNTGVTGSDNKGDNKGDGSANDSNANADNSNTTADDANNGSNVTTTIEPSASNGNTAATGSDTKGTTQTVNGNTQTGDTAPLMAFAVTGLAAAGVVVAQRKRILGR